MAAPREIEPIRIACWSGPRNISTALMRAWENRDDTIVHDEPLYASYLERTGIEHPGREEIIATYETDPEKVVAQLTRNPLPSGLNVYYQKHMAHHLLPGDDTTWVLGLRNVFLIRRPAEVIASYYRVRPDLALEDLGYPQQLALFHFLRQSREERPLVIDARDVLRDPEGLLTQLCHALGVPFSSKMMSWPAGPRPSDGIWARYWYRSVEASTGFAPYRPKQEDPPAEFAALLEQAEDIYAQLHEHRIR